MTASELTADEKAEFKSYFSFGPDSDPERKRTGDVASCLRAAIEIAYSAPRSEKQPVVMEALNRARLAEKAGYSLGSMPADIREQISELKCG